MIEEKIIIKNIGFLALFILVMAGFSINANAMSAESAVLIEKNSRKILYEKNSNNIQSMASTTKIMTALVALEYGNLDSKVTVSTRAANVEGSSMYLRAGQVFTLEELIYGLMLKSGNDAAVAIAEHIGGSVQDFARLMNEKAKEIGALNTQFKNPNGLDEEGHYTTAYDLAVITAAALENDTFAKIVKTKTYKVGENTLLVNHNKLLSRYPDCDGVKTGFTKKSGRCLVTSATRNGVTLVAVTLNDPDDWADHTFMLDYGFKNYIFEKVVSKEDIYEIEVKNGIPDRVRVKPKQDLVTVSGGKVNISMPNSINAPVFYNQQTGHINVDFGSHKLQIPLIIQENSKRIYKFTYVDTVKMMFKNLLTIFVTKPV